MPWLFGCVSSGRRYVGGTVKRPLAPRTTGPQCGGPPHATHPVGGHHLQGGPRPQLPRRACGHSGAAQLLGVGEGGCWLGDVVTQCRGREMVVKGKVDLWRERNGMH